MEPEPAVKRRNGRKYLVEQLPGLERVDSSLWNTIVGGLFDANDRISESAVVGPLRSKLIIATRAEESQLSINLPRWTIHATQVLSNLAVDIELLKNKLIQNPWSDWNKDILKDCLQLINFLLWRFLNGEHTEPLLSKCRAKKLDLVEIREGGGRTYNELADSLEQSLKCTQNKLASLLSCKKDHRKELQRLMKEGSDGTHGIDPKISTATLRELLVRNEAHLLRSQIINCIKSTPCGPADVMPGLGGGVAQATRTVMSGFSKLSAGLLQPGPSHINSNGHAWHSRTIVVVMDKWTGILFTGGTKLTCHESKLFTESATAISEARLGGKTNGSFVRVVQLCAEEFQNKITQVARGRQGRSLVSSLSAGTKDGRTEIDNIHDEITESHESRNALPTSEEGLVLSWACRADNFQPKSPCLRCQTLYSTWVMHLTPVTANDKLEDLKEWLTSAEGRGDGDNQEAQLSNKIIYCAETAAAAKLHLLRKGTLALV